MNSAIASNERSRECEIALTSMPLTEFRLFRELIHRETGIWLRDGKQVMLASRLSKRLRHYGLTSFAEYYSFLERNHYSGEEIGELINCVTTNKTSFFREMHHFDFLAETVVPEIQRLLPPGAPRCIRVWSAACSTGQEPYSIGISLLEALRSSREAQGMGAGWSIQLVASDIDTVVLATARRGIYEEESLDTMDVGLRRKYFLRGKAGMHGQVKVKPELARLVEFKRINLMDKAWPLEGPFDAIFFRNALIYFNQQTQENFLRRMTRYLRPRGYLFLGHSENVPWLHDVVEPLNKTMYQLRDVPR